MPHFYERIKNKTLKYDEELSKLSSMLYQASDNFFGKNFVELVDSNCFRTIKLCGNYLSLQSMLEEIFEIKSKSAKFVCISELVLSLYEQIKPSMIKLSDRDFVVQQLTGMKNLILYDLDKLNLNADIVDESIGKVASIGPKSELLESALEVVDNKTIETRLIRYNSLANKGNICEKENILCAIYSYVEGFLNDNELAKMNSRLFQNVAFLYNNLNMKHNNDCSNDTFFYESTLSNREEWLDRLFHNVLLVIASKKERETNKEINELKLAKKNSSNE